MRIWSIGQDEVDSPWMGSCFVKNDSYFDVSLGESRLWSELLRFRLLKSCIINLFGNVSFVCDPMLLFTYSEERFHFPLTGATFENRRTKSSGIDCRGKAHIHHDSPILGFSLPKEFYLHAKSEIVEWTEKKRNCTKNRQD